MVPGVHQSSDGMLVQSVRQEDIAAALYGHPYPIRCENRALKTPVIVCIQRCRSNLYQDPKKLAPRCWNPANPSLESISSMVLRYDGQYWQIATKYTSIDLFSISFAHVISFKSGAANTVPKMNKAREKSASTVTCKG
jgi:hypothetical protein